MKFDFKKYLYIGCIPLWSQKHHPTDRSPCIIKKCPSCKKEIWVSEKKRDMKTNNPTKVKIVCLTCIAQNAIDNGLEMDLVDLNSFN